MKNHKKVFFVLKKHAWIILWAILSIIVAFLIHICFKIDVPSEFWIASWSSGEILTYISTVALGLLAFYQNQKITQLSNDRDKYTFAVEHSALFDFGNIRATYMDDVGNMHVGKLIDSGFNGNKAIWKYRSVSNMSLLKLEIDIANENLEKIIEKKKKYDDVFGKNFVQIDDKSGKVASYYQKPHVN